MNTEKQTRWVNLILLSLVVLDIVLFTVCFFFPDFWFLVFHGTEAIDPQGLLRRTGGLWVAFTIFQTIAFFRWKKEPLWLAVVAGVRFTEIVSDWIYLGVAQDTTLFAKLALFVAPPANLLLGFFLLKIFKNRGHRIESTQR